MQHSPLYEPFYFEPDTGVDEAVEMATCVFERECILVDEALADEEMDFGRQASECRQPFPPGAGAGV